MCIDTTGWEDIDDWTRLAVRVTGDSTALPSSDIRHEKQESHSYNSQVWVTPGKLLVEAMLFEILGCHQAEICISA